MKFTRDELHKKIIEIGASKKDGILNIAPRVGKTRIVLKILQSLNLTSSILVLYPSIPIKQAWEEECIKVGYYGNIEYSAFASLHKHENLKYDTIIIDECHALSNRNIESLSKMSYKVRMGLTGTLSKETEQILKERLNLPVLVRYTMEEAISEGIVSDYRIKVITVPLDNQILKQYGKKKRTEKQQFDHLTRVIDWMERSGKSTFHMRLARMRLIQSSRAKLLKTKQLLNNTDRTLVFCGLSQVTNELDIPVYHSKEKDEQRFLDFCNGKGNNMAVIKLAQAGVTIRNLDRVIFNYTDSNEENFLQKINRAMNYDYNDKIAKITIISTNEIPEIRWITKALKPLNQQKVTWV